MPRAAWAKLPEPRALARPATQIALSTADLADRTRRAALLGHRVVEPGGSPADPLQRRADSPLTQSEPGDPFELQAEEVAARVGEGLPAGDLLAAPVTGRPPDLSSSGMGKKAKKRKAAGALDDPLATVGIDGSGDSKKRARQDRTDAAAAAADLSGAGSGAKGASAKMADSGTGGGKTMALSSRELKALAVGAPSLQPEPLRLLDLAWERLADFSANLENVSRQQLDPMKAINPDFAEVLEARYRLGRKIAKEAPKAYQRLAKRIRGAQEEEEEPATSSSSSSSSSRRKASGGGETDELAEVRRTIELFEVPMQEIQTLFASPPPSKKWPDFQGNPATPALYHTGDAADPIPFVWYKSPDSYGEVEAEGKKFAFPKGPALPFFGGQPLTADAIQVGEVLYNVGSKKESRGDTVPRVRKSLTFLGATLKDLDIDHVRDLGFGGADRPDNMWPLAAGVNRRPVLGWRSHYGLNYRVDGGAAAPPELRTAAINDLVGKWFVVKGFMRPDDAEAVPEEGREPMRKSGVLTADEGKV